MRKLYGGVFYPCMHSFVLNNNNKNTSSQKHLKIAVCFASVNHLFENLPGLLFVEKDQKVDCEKVWEQCYM